MALWLTWLINLITNLAFYGQWTTTFHSPAAHALGAVVVTIPVIGAVLIGVMARYGSRGIQGHGIPEAMEQALLNEGRIPARLTILKPLSAAISIGTGGPFGAEGPIIATGGALGSFCGQLLRTTAIERRTLLAAGAAAGLTATFASPVAATLLAVELLLFEYRARSLIPVALASVAAQGMRTWMMGPGPVFPLPGLTRPTDTALAVYLIIGGLVGIGAVVLTRAVHAIEHQFTKLPLHWMWHPALGAVIVGLVGWVDPRVFGVGYEYIQQILTGSLTGQALFWLGLSKVIAWSVYVASGTSGGTLAPMFIMGGALGAALGNATVLLFPGLPLDMRLAALVGMTAIFAGASRAFLASVLLALEMTHQPLGLLPTFGACTTSFLVSGWLMPSTIMTGKMARRGITVPEGYTADLLSYRLVKDFATRPAVVLHAQDTTEVVQQWLRSGVPGSQHTAFPVVDHAGILLGVLARSHVLQYGGDVKQPIGSLIKQRPVVVSEDDSIRAAMNLMASEDLGRLPVVGLAHPEEVVAILSRRDVMTAYAVALQENRQRHRTIFLPWWRSRGTSVKRYGDG